MLETYPQTNAFNIRAVVVDWFRIVRERPVAVLSITVWSVLLLLVPVVLSRLIPFIDDESLRRSAQILNVPIVVIAGFVFVIGMPVAWLRLVVNGEIKPGFPLRLGKDEWRFAGAVFLIHAAGGLGALCALPIVYGAIALVELSQTPLAWPIPLLPMTLMMVPYVWVFARLGPALAIGMKRQRLFVTASWRATRPIRFTLLLVWIPLIAGSLLVPSGKPAPPSSGEMVVLDILPAVVALAVFVLLTGWAMSIHAAVARYLLEVDPDLGLGPEPAPPAP